MTMDAHDIEWVCDCGAVNIDNDDDCQSCGSARYPERVYENDMSSINVEESPSYRRGLLDSGRGYLLL